MGDDLTFGQAFVAAVSDLPPIPKSKTVNTGSYSYKYADLPTILELVSPVLARYGLAVAQSVVSEDGRMGVETRIYHEGSDHVESFGPVFLFAGNDAQSAGSAITYARRYSLCAALGIAADEDDDGSAASRREDPTTEHHGDWLKRNVAMFSEWSDDERRQAYKAVMAELGMESVSSMEDAKRVHEAMSETYYTEHPSEGDKAPF